MIEFYYTPTPNGWKIATMLEECGLQYDLRYLDIFAGAQFEPDFLTISPSAKMPAIVDREEGAEAVSVFESGAILLYLAEKAGRFLDTSPLGRKETNEWLFWQTGNLGPMAGQLAHFRVFGPGTDQAYSLARYAGEFERCLGVLERRLDGRDFLVADYSIADMQCFPWVLIAKNLGASLDRFPNLARWRETIKNRPAVQRAVNLMKDRQNHGQINASNNKVLYNQSADHILGAGKPR